MDSTANITAEARPTAKGRMRARASHGHHRSRLADARFSWSTKSLGPERVPPASIVTRLTRDPARRVDRTLNPTEGLLRSGQPPDLDLHKSVRERQCRQR